MIDSLPPASILILGALLVLLSLVLGRDPERPLLPVALVRWLQAAAPLAFTGIGAVVIPVMVPLDWSVTVSVTV